MPASMWSRFAGFRAKDAAGASGRGSNALSAVGPAGAPTDVSRPHDGPESAGAENRRALRRLSHPSARIRSRRIQDLERELGAIGCNVPLVPFGQGFRDMAPAVDALESLVEEGKLRHAGHPVLAMAAANGMRRQIGSCRSAARPAASTRSSRWRALGVAKHPAPVIDIEALIG